MYLISVINISLVIIIFLFLGFSPLLVVIPSLSIFTSFYLGMVIGVLYVVFSHMLIYRGHAVLALKNIWLRGIRPNLTFSTVISLYFFSFYEEVIWRVYIQQFLQEKYSYAGVLISATCFFLVHYRYFGKNALLPIIELMIFCHFISWVWYVEHDFYLVVFIHFVRNYISANMTSY